MKNIQKIALVFSVVVFVLSACLDSKNNTPTPSTVSTKTETGTAATGTTTTTTTPTGTTSAASVSFVNDIMPLIKQQCLACHQAPTNSGGINLETYTQVKKYVDNGKFYGSISGAKGYSKMPPGGTLASTDVTKVKSWIDAGAIDDSQIATTQPVVITPPVVVVTPPSGSTSITIDCPTGNVRVVANARTNDGPENGNNSTTSTSVATVCFDKEVLPFFQSSCAFSGCHDSKSKKDGYDLSNYTSIVSKGISKGNSGSSDIYKAMSSTGKDRMPPAPYPAIAKDKLDMIAKWIQEGAQNKVCGTSGTSTGTTGTTGTTTTVTVNFAAVNSIIQANCVSCHQSGFTSAGVNLDSYANIKNYGTNGRLYGSISGAAGYKKMPPSGQLTTCDIAIIKKWIDIGMPNN